MVPWKVEKTGGNTRIYVYDNNRPGNDSQYVQLNSDGSVACTGNYPNVYEVSASPLSVLVSAMNGNIFHGGQLYLVGDSGASMYLGGENVDDLYPGSKFVVEDGQPHDMAGYWLPDADYTISLPDSDPVSITVLFGAEKPISMTLLPEAGGATVELGDTVRVGGSAFGNVVAYSDDGAELLMPIVSGSVELAAEALEFRDVGAGDWYSAPVATMSVGGIMGGVGGELFDPDGTLTAAQLLTMLVRTQFGELAASGEWYAPYIDKALAEGLLLAGDGLGPNDFVTRAQAALLVTRYIERYNPRWAKERVANAPGDIASVPSEYMGAVEKAYAWDIIHGDESGNFNPGGTLTRAQVATILYNYYAIVD
jgi:hypothetical protein